MSHKATLAVRTGIETDTQHGAVVPPIYLSSNYTFADFGEPRQYDYARSGNPTRTNLADALAALEGGAGAVVTGTGMGAIHLVTTALLKAGDLLIAPHDCYGGTWRLFEYLAAKGHYKVQFVDQEPLDGAGRQPFVPEGDVDRLDAVQIAGEGAARLGPRPLRAVHVQRQADHQPRRLAPVHQPENSVGVVGEFRLADQRQRAGDHPRRIADRHTDGLFAQIQPQPRRARRGGGGEVFER